MYIYIYICLSVCIYRDISTYTQTYVDSSNFPVDVSGCRRAVVGGTCVFRPLDIDMPMYKENARIQVYIQTESTYRGSRVPMLVVLGRVIFNV